MRSRRQGYLYRRRGFGNGDLNRESLTAGMRGFAISLAIIISPFAVIYFTSELLAGLHPASEENWLGEFFKELAISQAKMCIIVLAVYWSFSGLFGRGPVYVIKLANYLLIAAFSIVLGVTESFIIPILPPFDSLCDQLPYPGKYSLFELHKCPTSAITIHVLNFLFLFLVVSSGIVRVVQSRRKYVSKL